jgi:hypothetical protein
MSYIARMTTLAVLTAALGGCATVTRGTQEQFTVSSTPPGAQARTSTGFTCDSTPCTFKMPRKDSFVVTVSKDGYTPVETQIAPHVAGTGGAAFVGNALIGGVIGAGLDIYSGATMDLGPNPLNVTLVSVNDKTHAPAVVPPPPAPVATPAAATASVPTAASTPAGAGPIKDGTVAAPSK